MEAIALLDNPIEIVRVVSKSEQWPWSSTILPHSFLSRAGDFRDAA
jgi:hypothetical protein